MGGEITGSVKHSNHFDHLGSNPIEDEVIANGKASKRSREFRSLFAHFRKLGE